MHTQSPRLIIFSVFLLAVFFFSSVGVSATFSSPRYYLIHYIETDKAATQQYLHTYFGERIEGYVPDHQYIVYAREEELQKLLNKQIISSYVSYYDAFSIGPSFAEKTDRMLLTLFHTADPAPIKTLLEDHDIPLLDAQDHALIVPATIDIDFLKHVEGIQLISPVPRTIALNDRANIISGTPDIRQRLGLYGSQQIIAVADTGLDTGVNDNSMHDDLEGRIANLTNLAPLYLTKPWDKNGHGTHVAGSVLGNGVLSGSNPPQRQFANSYAGAAPEAQLIFQAIGDDQGSLFVYPPYPYSTKLFLPPYQQGASVHSNSWGYTGSVFYGMYENGAQNLDVFTSQYQDMVLVFAAGNDGYNGRGTVLPPSTAKNALSVGAADTSTPGQRAGFSSRGLTLDGRYKPDILAPGTNIVSTRSSAAPSCWSPGNTNYCTMSGTSMATPHVAGLIALLREYYVTRRNHASPSAALLKATLFVGADSMGKVIPDPDVGWGRANISRSLPQQSTDLFFADERQGLRTGQTKNYTLAVGAGESFTLVLTWTDVDGVVLPFNATKLVNDLDVAVLAPNGTQYNGNDVQPPYADQWDRKNNVERVFLSAPQQGRYTISVHGFNVPKGITQAYALVVLFDDASVTSSPVQPKPICQLANGTPC